ncbi:MAG TPA: MobF family relaxase, partial [Mycobacteriales bacterium]
RVGHHGGTAGRFVDAHDWTYASFFQHDNRDHDPQLHIHNAILNRVQCPDGQWRTLDSRAIHKFRGAAGAVGERVMEEHLSRSLGVRFETRPDGKAREIVGVPARVIEFFSPRRRAITAKTAKLVAAFETKFGRSPNSLELGRLQRQATFATRRAKSHEGELSDERLERWDRKLRAEVAGGLAAVARGVLKLGRTAREADQWSPSAVIETALADVQARKAAWNESDLARAISDALPAYLGGLNAKDVKELIDGLTAEAIATRAVPLTADGPAAESVPDDLRLADGRSAYDRPGGRLYATAEHISSEHALRAVTVQRGAPAVDQQAATRFIAELTASGIELGADQAAAVRGVLTSGARVETLVGPAGTGKSFVVGTLAKAWQDPELWDGQERRVVGLATSQIATEVLAGEGLTARNVAQWLAAQRRLAEGKGTREDLGWRLLPGDLVVVDESAMTATADLAAIRDIVAAADAKLLLTGDPRQLAAVGAGGGMDLAARTGLRYELAEARRFSAEWERAASLRLREGDQGALGDYRKHGRIIDAGTIEQAEAAAARGFLADTVSGRRSLLIVDTNEQAARVSAYVRAELIRLGRVTETGVPLGLQGTFAGVGDVVQARLNAWHLAGFEGNRRGPINRERYRVLATRQDGGLVVAPIIGTGPDGEHLGDRMTLPGSYVAEHVALGYASTVHAAQGLTVDTSHLIATGHTGPSALYVGMSRGRHANTAYVTTVAVPDDAPPGAADSAQRRDPLAVLATAMETAQPEQAAVAEAEDSTTEAR